MARALLLALLLATLPAVPGAQTLGDAAAREKSKREQKAREGKPPGKVYTEADLGGGQKAGEGHSPETTAYTPGPPTEEYTPTPAPRERPRAAAEEGDSESSPSGEDSSVPPPATEEGSGSWDSEAATARERLQQSQARVTELERRIEDLRERLNPTSTRYEVESLEAGDDGLVSRRAELQRQLASAESELAEERKELEAARQAWEDFARQARSAGAPESVLRDPGR